LPATIAAAADRHTWYFGKPQKIGGFSVETICSFHATCEKSQGWFFLPRKKMVAKLATPSNLWLRLFLLCVVFEVVI